MVVTHPSTNRGRRALTYANGPLSCMALTLTMQVWSMHNFNNLYGEDKHWGIVDRVKDEVRERLFEVSTDPAIITIDFILNKFTWL